MSLRFIPSDSSPLPRNNLVDSLWQEKFAYMVDPDNNTLEVVYLLQFNLVN